MLMGRPRHSRKDLPPGLYVDATGNYFYRSTKPGPRPYTPIGKVPREAAIARWVELTTEPGEDATPGTVAELIDRFVRDEIPGYESKATRDNYTHHCKKLREQWGARRYAQDAAHAVKIGALRKSDIYNFLTAAKKAGKGYNSATQRTWVLQKVFACAGDWGLTEYNPCKEVSSRASSGKLVRLPTMEQILAAQNHPKAGERLRLMIELGWRTGMRPKDIRELRVGQVKAELEIETSKSHRERAVDFAMTPALRALFARAEKLPGRDRSLFVFPGPTGQPISKGTLNKEWLALQTGYQFRALRKWFINQKIALESLDKASEAAGHADRKVTKRHYDLTPKKATPLGD